ncbi:unnamed protein product, partial [marine sediment metagenome]
YGDFKDGIIDGDRRGNVKKWQDHKSETDKIDLYFEEIEKKYSQGKIISIKKKKGVKEKELEKIKKARKFHAFNLNNEIKKLEEELKSLNNEDIKDLSANMRDCYTKRKEIEIKKAKAEKLAKEYSQLGWLQIAQQDYTRHKEKAHGRWTKFSIGLFITAFLVLSAGGLFTIIFNNRIVFLIAFIIGAIATIFAIITSKRFSAEKSSTQALNQLENEYEQNFGDKLSSESDFGTKIREMDKAKTQEEILIGQIDATKD